MRSNHWPQTARNTLFIDPMKMFCDGRRCLPFGDRGLFYSDENHLTPLGAEMIYNGFQRELRWAFGKDSVN